MNHMVCLCTCVCVCVCVYVFAPVCVCVCVCVCDSPSMSSLCMMMASSTSLGMYPRERMAIPSSCLEMNPFPSRSSTLKASRISARTNRKLTQHVLTMPFPPTSKLPRHKHLFMFIDSTVCVEKFSSHCPLFFFFGFLSLAVIHLNSSCI